VTIKPGITVASAGAVTESWYPVTLPCTVLNALVKHIVYPDPRTGLNLFQIPDASDEFNDKYNLAQFSHLPDKANPWKDPYWYRTVFSLPANCRDRQWLAFDGINYRADVWLNGKQIAKARDMVGAFLRYKYDITDYINRNEANYLAVKIYCLDHIGVPGTQLTVFQAPRTAENFNGGAMKDVTFNIAAEGFLAVNYNTVE